MRTSLFFKVLVLIVLGICTSLVTSSIIARSKVDVIAEVPAGTTKFADPTTPAIKAGPLIGAGGLEPTFGVTLDRASVSANGRRVTASAAVSIMPNQPNFVNMWSLVVRNATGEGPKVSEQHYDNQLFKTTATENTTPTFKEDLDLAPGKYVVEINLYTIPVGFNVALLNDDTTAEKWRYVSAIEKLTVPQD